MDQWTGGREFRTGQNLAKTVPELKTAILNIVFGQILDKNNQFTTTKSPCLVGTVYSRKKYMNNPPSLFSPF